MENKNCVVTLYPGIASDTEILASGQGNKSIGKTADNIVFKLVELPHPRFKRNGDNIEEVVTINLKQALLGFKYEANAIDGEPVVEDIPGPIQNEQTHTFTGRGMAVPKTDKRGDYIIKFKVVLPTSLTDEQRKAIETLF